jgi:hypothetical protein
MLSNTVSSSLCSVILTIYSVKNLDLGGQGSPFMWIWLKQLYVQTNWWSETLKGLQTRKYKEWDLYEGAQRNAINLTNVVGNVHYLKSTHSTMFLKLVPFFLFVPYLSSKGQGLQSGMSPDKNRTSFWYVVALIKLTWQTVFTTLVKLIVL